MTIVEHSRGLYDSGKMGELLDELGKLELKNKFLPGDTIFNSEIVSNSFLMPEKE